jgi:hypothetical protein
VNETKEPKIARKGVPIALGLICIILVACLGGLAAAYTLMISDKNSTISSLNHQISQLNSSVSNLTSQVTNLQEQLYPNTTYTVVGTLAYANVSAVTVGITVASISPSFYPNLTGSFMYVTFDGQLTSTWPINQWTTGSMVTINGTISFDSYSQTYYLNWINGSLYSSKQLPGINQQLGLQLTMALQKTNYSLGEPINITLTLTNISNQTVSFWLDLSFSYFQFLVYNSTGSAIYSSLNNGGALLPLAEEYTLNAGQSISDSTLSWQQTWHNTISSPEGTPVSPGTYYIVGQVGPIYYGTNSTIETTPVQITID